MDFDRPEPPRILVVEDEMLIALSTSDALSDLGYEVSGIAGTPESALRSAADCRPDLVLMDIRLRGGSDGIEAARLLRSWFDVPILFVTAHADGPTMERAASADPVGYLVKPFSRQQLEKAVTDAMRSADRRR